MKKKQTKTVAEMNIEICQAMIDLMKRITAEAKKKTEEGNHDK